MIRSVSDACVCVCVCVYVFNILIYFGLRRLGRRTVLDSNSEDKVSAFP